jgi:Fe2+ transport system protein FeoA
MLLKDLAVGKKAQVVNIQNSQYLDQLHAMGILTGCDIMLLRYSPMNDLMLLKVGSSLIAIQSAMAQSIEINI